MRGDKSVEEKEDKEDEFGDSLLNTRETTEAEETEKVRLSYGNLVCN